MNAKEVLRIFNRKRLTSEGKLFQRGFISGFVECHRQDPHTLFKPIKARRDAKRAFEKGRRITVDFAQQMLAVAAKQSK